jgi:integrase
MSSMIETHIVGTSLGGRRLTSVLPSEVQSWASDRAKELGPLTVRNLVSILRSIYASAVLDRLVGASPVVRVALPRHERERVVPLTVDQVGRLAAAMPTRNQAMVITQAGLGLRIGELLALRAVDVDFLHRTARVEFQIAPGSKTRSEPKTPRSRRTLPLPQVVADALAAHMAAYPPAADGRLFFTKTGAVYWHAYYGAKLFKAAVRKVGLPESTTTHDLRHHYASVLPARRGERGRGCRAARPPEREPGSVHLRAPHAGQRGTYPQGHRRGLECARCARGGRKWPLTWVAIR